MCYMHVIYFGMSVSQKTAKSFEWFLIRSCGFHTSSNLNTFWVRDEKGGYKGGTAKIPPITERIPEGLKELKKEIFLFGKEVHDEFHGINNPLLIRPGEIDIKWKFGYEASLDHWVTSADSDHNEGMSNCELSLTKDGKGLFSGELCKIAPKDGRIARAGYCNMKTKTFRLHVFNLRSMYRSMRRYTHRT
ncbi:hypothetical protein HHI36_001146 [Cryptolaemus montrouzieri]|uniref:NADH:ubiquinone oxidoreductase intermediate-associated protein 30 domain-containing protein n=1 Tax=Cryptolaemus montrouzieri TaxID=559131 RepID=A0ABD2P7E1_9CUCU